MPRSKRAKVVHLSKVEKKGKQLSQKLFTLVREAADKYQFCFVFSVENMRNTYLKDVRSEFSESRLFFGKTKVMAKALGLTPEEEHLPNLSRLARYLSGNVGLLFTNEQPESVIDFFASYAQTDFARAGIEASQDFIVPEGIIYSRAGEIPEEEDTPVAHSIEPTLRNWGMPTRLIKGRITLDAPFTVCKEGQLLNSNQTALLKMFGVAMAEFRLHIRAYYDSAKEDVHEVDRPDE